MPGAPQLRPHRKRCQEFMTAMEAAQGPGLARFSFHAQATTDHGGDARRAGRMPRLMCKTMCTWQRSLEIHAECGVVFCFWAYPNKFLKTQCLKSSLGTSLPSLLSVCTCCFPTAMTMVLGQLHSPRKLSDFIHGLPELHSGWDRADRGCR